MHLLLPLVSYGITILANSVLGIIVLLRSPKQETNRSFALLTLSIVLWIGSVFLYYTISAQPWLLWIGRINFSCAVLIPFTTFRFLSIFPERLVAIPRWMKAVVYGLSFLFFTLCFTPLIDANEIAHGTDRITTFGSFYLSFLIELVVVSLLCISLVVIKWKRATGIFRSQLLYFLLGFVTLFIIAIFFNGILPFFFNNSDFQDLGSLASIGFVGFTSYAIIRHRFMDINRVVAYVLKQVSVIISLGVIYLLAIYAVGVFFFPNAISIQYSMVAIVVCIGIRLILQPFGKYFEPFIESLYIQRVYRRGAFVKEIEDVTRSTKEFEEMTHAVLSVLVKNMRIRGASYLSLSENAIEACFFFPKIKKDFFRDEWEVGIVSQITSPILTEELPENDIKQFLQSQKIELVFPMQMTHNRQQLLLLGAKKNKDPYFPYDIKTLQLISQPFIIAIQSALHLEDIKEFNENLRNEVNKATRELRRVNVQLRHADKLKDEFISIASHELKTPNTAIQGFLWLVLQKDKTLSTYSREKLERVAKLTEHMTTLVNDMLDVSKIESKRISLHPEPFDIGQLAEEIKGELDLFAVQKNIEIAVKNGKPYTVVADKQRAHQIVSNLIHNAVKYTLEGGKITVSFKIKDNSVKVSVADTGIGIREEDKHKLFTKFGKLDDGNSISSHLPGTGLGLYITKSIVELSGGEIEVDSVHGKGSTFTFTLPMQ